MEKNFQEITDDFAKEFVDTNFGKLTDVDGNFEKLTDDVAKELVDSNFPALAAPAAKRNFDEHCLTHMPADPQCEVCQRTTLSQVPARRTDKDKHDNTATTFGERVHADLVGPTRPTLHNEVFALVTRDEGTDFPAHVHNMDQATLFNKHSEHPHALSPSGLFVLGSISNG